MTLAEARARIPTLATALVDDDRLAALRATILDALLVVSPRLGHGWEHLGRSGDAAQIEADFEDHVFFVEVCAPSDVDRLLAVVHELDLGPAAIGVADGAFAAACAARLVEPHPTPRPPKIVRRNDDARFLAPLPAALLPASHGARAALGALGLHTIALVAALPMEGVQARLGEEGRTLVALARGGTLPALATFVSSSEPSTEVDLVEGLHGEGSADGDGAVSLDAVIFALRAACLRLVPPLAARGEGLAEVEILLDPKPGRGARPTTIRVRPARPEIDPHALFELARATVEGALRTVGTVGAVDGSEVSAPPPPFVRLRLTATTLVPIAHAGESLAFARREATVLPLDVALARLRGRFGTDRVVTPVRHEDPRPEGRGVFRPATLRNVKPLDPAARRAIPAAIEVRERLRAPSPAIGAVILSRAPIPGDAWPIRAIERPGHKRPPRLVEEVSAVEHVASGWWSEPYALVYRWVTANDGVRALFARGAEQGGWRLVGIAD